MRGFSCDIVYAIRRSSARSLVCGRCDNSGEVDGFVNGLARLRGSLSFDLDGNFCDFGSMNLCLVIWFLHFVHSF